MNNKIDRFPEGFFWGGAISNAQAEGAIEEGNKGLSVYDHLEIDFELGQSEQDDPNIASKHYLQYEEDIENMKTCGFNACRFSILWARIHPKGDELEPNKEGLAFYDKVIDKMLACKIEPVVSLVHFDMPHHLFQKYNGFYSKEVSDFYEKNVRDIVEHFKGRVKYWITYNEMNTISGHSYLVGGSKKPNDVDRNEFYHVLTLHSQLAHAKAVNAIKEIDPSAKVSGMIAYTPIEAKTSKPIDVLAAKIYNDFHYFITFDVMCNGEFPNYYKQYFKRRNITYALNYQEQKMIKDASTKIDFLSFSYYQSRVIEAKDAKDQDAFIEKIIFDTPTSVSEYTSANAWGWAIDPIGYRKALATLYERYNLPLYVVENGIGLADKLDENNEVHDEERIAYHKEHIKNMRDAINYDGVEVLGYLMWSPFDFLSSHKEMRKRYGLVYIDNQSAKDQLPRIPKESFYWFQKMISQNGNNL